MNLHTVVFRWMGIVIGITIAFGTARAVTETKNIPEDPFGGDQFGCAVSISEDYALIGAHRSEHNGEMTGAVYVFERNGANWIRQQKLIASDESEQAAFGRSVASRHPWLLIGANEAGGQYPDCGAGYMYHFESGSWTAHSKLLPVEPSPNAGFGYSVDIDSGYAVIGAPFFGDSLDDSGRGDVYRLNGDAWEHHLVLVASDESDGARFGWTVAVQADDCLVGALNASDNGIESGAAYLCGAIGTIPPTPTASAFTCDLALYDTNLAAGDLFLLDWT